MTAQLSATLGWIALALILATALVAWSLRRASKGSYITRMRPHIILAFAAVAVTVVHLSTTTSAMGRANPNGIWLATFALGAICVQAFLGVVLQTRRSDRRPLRRWHIATFAVLLGLTAGHMILNAG